MSLDRNIVLKEQYPNIVAVLESEFTNLILVFNKELAKIKF